MAPFLFMDYCVYILFSKTLNKFYVGTTRSLPDRIRRHNANHKGFTGPAVDWIVVHSVQTANKTDALKLERKIKKRGAKRYLNDLDKNSG